MDLNLTNNSYRKLKGVVSRHHDKAKKKLEEKHAEAIGFLYTRIGTLDKLREHSTKLLASAAFTANVLLPSASHLLTFPRPVPTPKKTDQFPVLVLSTSKEEKIVADMARILPPEVGVVSEDTEDKLSRLFHDVYGIKAVAELDGKRLNYNYGRTGYEQHLPRYPGDTVDQHEEWQEEGITPGLGAWGYFADSKEAMMPQDYLKEKYYLVAQTWLSPNWASDPDGIYNWFKHRKMIMVNPENGRAVVGVLGDAGPAEWTGKVFGASPETMYYLRAHDGMRNEPVILFFVDDPQDKVPLGPIILEKDTKVAQR